MRFAELYQQCKKFKAAIALGRLLPARGRHILVVASALLVLLVGILGLLVFPVYAHQVFGVMILLTAFLIFILQLSAFYNFYYFSEVVDVASNNDFNANPSIELAGIVISSDVEDLTAPFLRSKYGEKVWARLGLSADDLETFLRERRRRLPASDFVLRGVPVTLQNYSACIFDKDRELEEFLFDRGINRSSYIGAVDWMARSIAVRKDGERWWSKRNLGKVSGIGKNWSYGVTFILDRYAVDAKELPEYSGVSLRSDYHEEEVTRLEDLLSRSRGANALLVSKQDEASRHVLAKLAKKIASGSVLAPLEHKNVMLVDVRALSSATGDGSDLEHELKAVMDQAAAAGNIILAFDDLAALIESGDRKAGDVIGVLSSYLRSSALQIVALVGDENYHRLIANTTELRGKFERVQIEESGGRSTLRLLERYAERIEDETGLFFTFDAVSDVAEGARRYITSAPLPDAAFELMDELLPRLARRGKSIVTRDEVSELITEKSGIPVASIDEDEKDKLLNLENLLHERVVAQNEAIDSVSSAMRRARSGINNPDRPMASFLFLGPTGVGKTETAKALAENFFGDEESVIRLDMSEYSSIDSVDKLIGAFGGDEPGTLAVMLRDRPYGVLLLDEFEKTHRKVMDLFLQILDEGVFRDMRGREVNARNVIIIATSNAASDLIWQYMDRGIDLRSAKDDVINVLVKDEVFRPELINRFDGVVLFHPLNQTHLKKVASRMLDKLTSRLKKRGVELSIDDELLEYLSKQGLDPRFGARELNRVIQNKIESVVADRLISSSGAGGQHIKLTKADIA